jgi:hypothetical protein
VATLVARNANRAIDGAYSEVWQRPRLAHKHLLHSYGTCRQMLPSYRLVLLGIITAVPDGYTAEKLPVFRRQRRRRSKWPVYLKKNKTGKCNQSKPPQLYRVQRTNKIAAFTYRFHTNVKKCSSAVISSIVQKAPPPRLKRRTVLGVAAFAPVTS